jgi:hypothetical protein
MGITCLDSPRMLDPPPPFTLKMWYLVPCNELSLSLEVVFVTCNELSCSLQRSVVIITNQDSTSSRLLPGSSNSCCICNLHALVHKQCHPVHITTAHDILQRRKWQLCKSTLPPNHSGSWTRKEKMGFVIHRKVVHSQSCTSLAATRKSKHSLMPAKFHPQVVATEAEPSHVCLSLFLLLWFIYRPLCMVSRYHELSLSLSKEMSKPDFFLRERNFQRLIFYGRETRACIIVHAVRMLFLT